MNTTTIMLLATALAAGCLSTTEEPVTEAAARAPFAATVDLAAAGEEYSLAPAHLVVPAGSEVRLTVRNVGALPHSYAIPSLGVNTGYLAEGEESLVTFFVDAAGEHAALCDVPGHAEAGMRGAIEAR